jgi:hypothetical protein
MRSEAKVVNETEKRRARKEAKSNDRTHEKITRETYSLL